MNHPIPDTPMYRAMRSGHLRRTGHELQGFMVWNDRTMLYELERTCCDRESAS